ncbi:MAG TPA: acetate--CoA ligase family protein [Streptosporangiaceae bacterium]|nr:acetate--CoA ligase family protein [Streptosporangiaceae bacterium]
MLEARSVALVGASPRPGSLGERMVTELARSPARPRTCLVNPRYPEIGGQRCYPRLDDLPGPVDLVLLGVPDAALEEQLAAAAARGDRAAVIFGSAFDVPGQPPGLRDRLATIARASAMALCGAGCMGFVNLARGLRAVGYLEPDPLPAGPVALVTHSGSVFSALLRARRGFGFSLAVSSGQELVTTAADYARYALRQPETKVLALVLEAIRDAGALRAVLADAATAGVPVVLLSAGASGPGRDLVAAHSGALAAADGAWEALAGAYGMHRVHDLAELTDTLELFALVRHPGQPPQETPQPQQHQNTYESQQARRRCGIATVHDSGLERAHVADLAASLDVPFADLAEATCARLTAVLDPGLEPANPLDVWGTGRDAEAQLTESLAAMAADPAVGAVAFAVDLVPEFDGDRSYESAVLAVARTAAKPVVILANLPAAIDPAAAARLRAARVPVLEGTRSGLLALRHWLDHLSQQLGRPTSTIIPAFTDHGRRERWLRALATGPLDGATQLDLLRDYGLPVVRARRAATAAEAVDQAGALGYPVVLKINDPAITHKSDVGGVVTGLAGPAELTAAYTALAARLGRQVLVCQTAPPGVELSLGLAHDPALGPLIVVAAGGVLVELLADSAVALPPVGHAAALALLRRLRAAELLDGLRGAPPADRDAIARAITALSTLALELGDALDALDVNPLICGPAGAIAVDALVIPRQLSATASPPLRPPGTYAGG